jgi:IclR family transcriptional regulator, pca regulon regulatory protein
MKSPPPVSSDRRKPATIDGAAYAPRLRNQMPRSHSRNARTTRTVSASAPPIPTLREPRFSQSLERGLAVLRCFTNRHRVLGISDLADELDMSRSTTHRYVLTLSALGYLEQQTSRKYRLSHRAADIGMAALNSLDVRCQARPLLDELGESTSSTVGLAVLDGAEIVYIDRAGGSQGQQADVSLGVGVGSRLPVHCTAAGKLLLAYIPEVEQRIVIAESNLAKHGPNTITSKRQLREELDEIRSNGFAIANSEFAAELCAIAAPVRDEARNVVAAIGLADHGSIASLLELSPFLISAADDISRRLGYRRDSE